MYNNKSIFALFLGCYSPGHSPSSIKVLKKPFISEGAIYLSLPNQDKSSVWRKELFIDPETVVFQDASKKKKLG